MSCGWSGRPSYNCQFCSVGKSGMISKTRKAVLLLLVLLWFVGVSFGDDAADLLLKALRKSDLWAQGPVQINAKLRAPGRKGNDQVFDYVLYWAAPDKWRVEWSGSGYTEKSVLDGGKLYRYRSSAVPPIQELAFDHALGFALGNKLAAPFYFPFGLGGLTASTDDFRGTPLECVGSTGHRACVNQATMQLFQLDYGRIIATYGQYAAAGDATYPQSIHIITSEGKILADAEISVSRPKSFAESTFSPVAEGTSLEYGSCSEHEEATRGPMVEHRVPPKRRLTLWEGTVWLYAAIGADGSVENAHVYSAPSSDLSKPALEAVRQWKFYPALRCGTQVPSEVILPFTFLLRWD